eukprot:gnl/MRDRNA2_/MRDRNA2_213341_c0_seq1.p1 gnl/MRDRNA2_/MRDRNA2_213341_c0~~gnl/MRDRNA2_/MRDRNA2_213341_c0_seq1.p1  ORF type:complete len:155 (-),score=15.14 gnl/MRDRNA2_/MRDRNA2_213341_c0_seq1:71-535(-)
MARINGWTSVRKKYKHMTPWGHWQDNTLIRFDDSTGSLTKGYKHDGYPVKEYCFPLQNCRFKMHPEHKMCLVLTVPVAVIEDFTNCKRGSPTGGVKELILKWEDSGSFQEYCEMLREQCQAGTPGAMADAGRALLSGALSSSAQPGGLAHFADC